MKIVAKKMLFFGQQSVENAKKYIICSRQSHFRLQDRPRRDLVRQIDGEKFRQKREREREEVGKGERGKQ